MVSLTYVVPMVVSYNLCWDPVHLGALGRSYVKSVYRKTTNVKLGVALFKVIMAFSHCL